MDSADTKSVQPGRGPGDRVSVPTNFTGTVTNITEEKGQQTLEVQYAHGKVKFQADGDFQSGEKVRLSFPGGNSVEVAKANTAASENESQNSAVSESLEKALAGLDRTLLQRLTKALQDMPDNSQVKAQLQQLLHSQETKNNLRNGLATQGQNLVRVPQNLEQFWSTEAGDEATTWFGLIVAKNESSITINNGADPRLTKDSLFKYLVDVGGRELEVLSAQSKEKGDLAEFKVAARPGKMGGIQAEFLPPTTSLPDELTGVYEKSAPIMQKSLQLSARYLQDFKAEPYFGKLVQDFAEVISQSGRVDANVKSEPTPKGLLTDGISANGHPQTGLPSHKDLEGLLKLFLAFPRDPIHPEKQAKIWGDAVQNPKVMVELLKSLKPEKDQTLLRQDTSLQVSKNSNSPTALSMLTEAGNKGAGITELGESVTEASPEALAHWLKKILPESFKSSDLQRIAQDASTLANAAPKESDPAKFLLQAMVNSFPKPEDMQQGNPTQAYFYQGQDWRGLQVTWQKERSSSGKESKGPTEPLKISVNTQAKLMGKVNVDVTLTPKGATLDFKNQFHNVRDLLSQYLPELEKGLDYLDFKVKSWTYEMLPVTPDDPATIAPGAWTKVALPSDGSKLDLLG